MGSQRVRHKWAIKHFNLNPDNTNLFSFQECFKGGIIQYVTSWMSFFFTECSSVEIHPSCSVYQLFVLSHWWAAFHSKGIPHCFSTIHCWKTLGWFVLFSKISWIVEQSFGLCGKGRGWDDLGEWHWNTYNIIYGMSRQSRFDARYWMLGAGALGWHTGMVWGGRMEVGSGWGTHV